MKACAVSGVSRTQLRVEFPRQKSIQDVCADLTGRGANV
jgi:hypothetical protein